MDLDCTYFCCHGPGDNTIRCLIFYFCGVNSNMANSKSYHIAAKVHGYYLIQKAKGSQKNPLLVGFHGYGETAEDQMHLLQQIPGIENWTVCSIQALHSFYISKGKVGYSWMTSQDRELRVKENVYYVNAVISEIKKSPIAISFFVFRNQTRSFGTLIFSSCPHILSNALLYDKIPPRIISTSLCLAAFLVQSRIDIIVVVGQPLLVFLVIRTYLAKTGA